MRVKVNNKIQQKLITFQRQQQSAPVKQEGRHGICVELLLCKDKDSLYSFQQVRNFSTLTVLQHLADL